MPNSNLNIWERLGKTDPAHTKKFQRAGGFKGTAIKPIYTEHKMTEEFGPAGQGWGMEKPSFQVVTGSDGQVAVFCTVGLWWGTERLPDGSPQQVVYGVGGDMVVVKQTSGLRTDDEAFKKAFTDAVGNAMKHLGMSADVHMGLFDDSKYVREREQEEASAEPVRPTGPARQNTDDSHGGEPGNTTSGEAGNRLPKAKARELYERLQKALDERESALGIESWFSNDKVQAALATLPADWEGGFRSTVETKYNAAIKSEGAEPPLSQSAQASLDELVRVGNTP